MLFYLAEMSLAAGRERAAMAWLVETSTGRASPGQWRRAWRPRELARFTARTQETQ